MREGRAKKYSTGLALPGNNGFNAVDRALPGESSANLRDSDAGTLIAHSSVGAYRRKSVIENTRMRISTPNKPSSYMLALNMLEPSRDQIPPCVRLAASKVITSMRLIEAIRPTTRNGSVTRTWE